MAEIVKSIPDTKAVLKEWYPDLPLDRFSVRGRLFLDMTSQLASSLSEETVMTEHLFGAAIQMAQQDPSLLAVFPEAIRSEEELSRIYGNLINKRERIIPRKPFGSSPLVQKILEMADNASEGREIEPEDIMRALFEGGIGTYTGALPVIPEPDLKKMQDFINSHTWDPREEKRDPLEKFHLLQPPLFNE